MIWRIEYVEDPNTHKRVPTVNRTQVTSIFADEDYKSAIKYSDPAQREIYENEAKTIDEIQKGILEISNKEKPFDVFICYKESDQDGNRTVDSTLAQDIYYQLTKLNKRIFFARITLEDKVGSAYEPYIFSALNSAKIMIVVGTKHEYLNSVWVKNEWSRFLSLMKNDHRKYIIPCYRDMDPYDLPDQLSTLQSYNMANIGFIQDLIRGVTKILESDKQDEAPTPVDDKSNANRIVNINKRGYMAIEDSLWEEADKHFGHVLDIDPSNADANIGKILTEEKQTDIMSFIDIILKKLSQSASQKIEAATPDNEHIEEMVNKYSILSYLSKNTIRKLYEFNLIYECTFPMSPNLIDSVMNNFDKMFIKVHIAVKGEEKNKFEKIRNNFKHEAERIISKNQNAVNDELEKIREAYKKHIEDADKKAKELYEEAYAERDKDYKILCKSQRRMRHPDGLKKLSEKFGHIKDYADCQKRSSQCLHKAKVNQYMSYIIMAVLSILFLAVDTVPKIMIDKNGDVNWFLQVIYVSLPMIIFIIITALLIKMDICFSEMPGFLNILIFFLSIITNFIIFGIVYPDNGLTQFLAVCSNKIPQAILGLITLVITMKGFY